MRLSFVYESHLIMCMKARILSLASLVILISSCTPAEQEKYFNYHHGGKGDSEAENSDGQRAVLPLLDPQGINMDMMDSRLADMVREANDIEFQIAVLIERLQKMRNEISGFALVKKVKTESPSAEQSMKTIDDIVDDTLEPDAGEPSEQGINNEHSGVVADESIMNLMAEEEAAEPQETKPQPKPQPQAQKPVPSGDGVVDVRVGVHHDKTRIVLDVNGSTKNNVNFDREAGLLTVTMPDTEWSAPQSKTYKLSQIQGYEAKSENGGTVIAMAVTQTSNVDTVTIARKNNRPARLVIDLMK